MLINLKVKTLDSQTHEFSIDNEITVRDFKDKVAEKTNIAADQQRIIYCGRVMVDDKQLKDYDVDGKVLHVAERPPPSQRLLNTESSPSGSGNNTERRSRTRLGTGGMRNSPLFRALDGMVVGTMAFPMNANANGQTPVNPLAASSSFCMNRITVARHMLDCANNIAAFLEDPSRGLNNQSLDILTRGRWTMESTVVEVGISSDIPESQQIVEMVQGAVQAALRRSGNTNVTLVQLPTVYSSSEGEANTAAANANNANANANANLDSTTDGDTDADVDADTDAETAETDGEILNAVETETTAAPTVAIDELLIDEEDDDTPTNEQSTENNSATTPAAAVDMEADNTSGSASATEESNVDQSRRRTGVRVLARVIEQMRNVQNRLNPFIEQYYEMLQNEPTFETDDTTGRENAQRLFDRVSEAFHYMSHAQHAISDLMLDVSQPSPRFLTCRPILVEQSGYVSSNFITPAVIPAGMAQQQQPARGTVTGGSTNANNTSTNTRAVPSTNVNTVGTNTIGSPDLSNITFNATVDDPIDDLVRWPPTLNFGPPSPAGENTNTVATNTVAGRGNLQRQVARLLQDVVSAAPFDTEFHVHINSPNVVSIDVPIGGPSLTAAANAATAGLNHSAATNNRENNTSSATDNNTSTGGATTPPTTNDSATTSPASASTPSNANPARVTTATLPTTSTQTRSTARPQVHIGNIPVLSMPSGWNGRALPMSSVSSFDRFLPCNSHHIREHEAANNANNANANVNFNANQSNSHTPRLGRGNRANIITRRPLRSMIGNIHRFRLPPTTRLVSGSTMTDSTRSGSSALASTGMPVFGEFGPIRTVPNRVGMSPYPSATTPSNFTGIPRQMAMPEARLPSGSRLVIGSTMVDPSRSGSVASASAGSEIAMPDLDIISEQTDIFRDALEMIRNRQGISPSSSTTVRNNSVPETRQRNMHKQLKNFIANHIFEGKPINDETMPPAINRAIKWFGKLLIFLPQFEKPEYDSVDSLFNILRNTLPLFLKFMNRTPMNLTEFEQKLNELCKQFRTRMYSVLYVCIGRDNVEMYWSQLMRLLSVSIRSSVGDDVEEFLTLYLNPTLPSCTDEDDAKQFIVYRNSSNNSNSTVTPMDTDEEMRDVAGTSHPIVDDEPLPTVVSGSAAWHRHFPNNWLPIITRDIQKQRENPPNQPPFSDAYITGMSSKQKKSIQQTKPPTEINALIADSVKKAIQSTGAGSSTSSSQTHTPDDIARIIANDASVQSSCTEAARLNLRERLMTESDYNPEKFPKSTKFIKK